MRGNQRRAALPAHEFEELGENLVRRRLVQVAGGLARQHQTRPVRKRTGDGHALLFAARKLAGP